MASKSADGPTPNGGVRSTMFFLDDDGREAAEELATRAVIVEYDEAGNPVHRTYGTLDRPAANPDLPAPIEPPE